MRKFGSIGLKILKLFHILLIVLFLGGILSSFALLMKLNLGNFDDVYMAYKTFNLISDNVVKIGAQGTILLGVALGSASPYCWLGTASVNAAISNLYKMSLFPHGRPSQLPAMGMSPGMPNAKTRSAKPMVLLLRR